MRLPYLSNFWMAKHMQIGDHILFRCGLLSGWDKRQATIVLCIFADGAMHIKLLLNLFKGAETLTRWADQQCWAAEVA